jgi:hypothetical protein
MPWKVEICRLEDLTQICPVFKMDCRIFRLRSNFLNRHCVVDFTDFPSDKPLHPQFVNTLKCTLVTILGVFKATKSSRRACALLRNAKEVLETRLSKHRLNCYRAKLCPRIEKLTLSPRTNHIHQSPRSNCSVSAWQQRDRPLVNKKHRLVRSHSSSSSFHQ